MTRRVNVRVLTMSTSTILSSRIGNRNESSFRFENIWSHEIIELDSPNF